MAYTKKTWVNVPDESNLPAIPDGQDSLARFDAENMNRLEDGIEEAINKAGDHTHSANDIESGIVGVEYGGTGKDNISKDNILVGNGTGAMIEKTPTQVRELIDAAPSSHTHPVGSHNHSTDNITSGTLGVSRGGTGKSSITKGNYLIGNDTSEMVEKTPDEVRANIGAAPSSHTHNKSQITDFPTSMPASDVYSWAKQPNKPSYSASEVGAASSSHTHINYDNHLNNKNNPHGVTASQIGASEIATGTYTGNAVRISNSTYDCYAQLAFDFEPRILFIYNGTGELGIFVKNGLAYGRCKDGASNTEVETSRNLGAIFDGNTVTWCGYTYYDALAVDNRSYTYIAMS